MLLRTLAAVAVFLFLGTVAEAACPAGSSCVVVSGDATVAAGGALTIANLAVTNAKIANTTIDLAAKVTGTLPVGNGGTGITSLGAGVATFLGTPTAANFLTMTGVLGLGSMPALTHSNFYVGDVGDRPIAVSVTGDLGFGTAAAGFVTGTVTGFQGRAFASTAPSDTNVICWDAGGTTWKPCAASAGTGTVNSVTDGSTTVSNPTQLKGGTGLIASNPSGTIAQLDLTSPQRAPTDGGSHSYTYLSTDANQQINLVSTFTAAALPQATGSFASGFGLTSCNAGAITLTSTTSTINGIAGATGIALGANQCWSAASDGTNWRVALGMPQPATQTGSQVFLSNMALSTAATDGQVLVGQTGAALLPKSLSQDCTLAASGAITCLKTNNASFGTAATVNTGTSGATIPLLNGNNTQSGTWAQTGVMTFTPAPVETAVALTGCNGSTATMDLTAGSLFHCTVSAGGVTFAVSNPAASGKVSSFTMELTNPGSQTLTFMSGTKWPGGSQPAWTAAGVDVAVCYTDDGATTWRCTRSMTDSK